MWVLCEGLPVCVAPDKVRSPVPAEALAYQYSHDREHYEPGPPTEQQRYVDARRPATIIEEEQEERSDEYMQDRRIESSDEEEDRPRRTTVTPTQQPATYERPRTRTMSEAEAGIRAIEGERRRRHEDLEPRPRLPRRRLNDDILQTVEDAPTGSAETPRQQNTSSGELLDAMERSGETGAGVDLLQRRQALNSNMVFWNERLG